jgi:lycopene beta-cyclase
LSYGQFLVLFLGGPIVVLTIVLRRRITPRFVAGVAALSLVAFLYTTPWDNAIVLLGVWTYDPALILGIVLGVVPLEEYLFYVLQTILTCLIVLALRTPATLGR